MRALSFCREDVDEKRTSLRAFLIESATLQLPQFGAAHYGRAKKLKISHCGTEANCNRYGRSMQRREEKYRSIVENAPVLICEFLPGGEITFVNDAYCRYFKKTQRELVGSSFLALIPEDSRESVVSNIKSLTASSPAQSHEHQVIGADGEIRWQRWTNRGIFNAQG